MSLPTFKYFIFDELMKALYKDKAFIKQADGNMNRLDNGQPAHLQESPEGWKDVLVKYARNIKYWALFRDMTLPLTFPGDGFEILVDAIRKHGGYEAVRFLGMQKLDREVLPYSYKDWYFGELNFVKARQNVDSMQIEVLEGGLIKYLKAFENTKYSIPIDEDPEHIIIRHDGMEVLNTGTFSVTNGTAFGGSLKGNHLTDLNLVSKEIDDVAGVYSVPRQVVANQAAVFATKQFFYDATTDGTIEFEYNYDLTIGKSGGTPDELNVDILRFKSDGTFVEKVSMLHVVGSDNILNFVWLGIHLFGIHHLKGTKNIDVEFGDKLFLYTSIVGGTLPAGFGVKFSYGGKEPFFSVKYSYRFRTTDVNGHLPKRWLQLIVDAMTGTSGVYTVESKLLDQLGKSFIIGLVSGDSLRGIAKATAQTSLSDFFKSFNRWGIALGIKGNSLIVEKWEDFFKDTIVVDLGEVDYAYTNTAEDLLFNSIKVGYPKNDYEEINGRYEVNQGQQWSTPVTKVQKDLDLTSAYRADAFGAELMRNLTDQKTTDSKNDREIWFQHIKKTNEIFSFQATNDTAKEYLTGIGNATYETLSGKYFKLNDTSDALIYTGQSKTIVQIDFSTIPFKNDSGVVRITLYRNADILGSVDVNADGTNIANISPVSFLIDPGDTISASVDYLGNGDVLVSLLNSLITIQFTSLSIYEINRPAYANVSGVLVPQSWYNNELSPHRSLLLNGSYLRSVLEQMDGKYLTLASADKNAEVSTTLGGVTIIENEKVAIGNLPQPKFVPHYIHIKTKVKINLLELIDADPYRKIRFTFRGTAYTGWMMDGGIKPATQDIQEWKLLSSYENDLSKLKWNK